MYEGTTYSHFQKSRRDHQVFPEGHKITLIENSLNPKVDITIIHQQTSFTKITISKYNKRNNRKDCDKSRAKKGKLVVLIAGRAQLSLNNWFDLPTCFYSVNLNDSKDWNSKYSHRCEKRAHVIQSPFIAPPCPSKYVNSHYAVATLSVMMISLTWVVERSDNHNVKALWENGSFRKIVFIKRPKVGEWENKLYALK